MPKFAVILPAAGNSTRFGGLQKKPFTTLEGRPVWQRAAELFWSRPEVVQVLIVISPDDRASFLLRAQALLAFNGASVVDGGSERFESVANALAKLHDEVEYVAVHDAVRPMTPPEMITQVFQTAEQTGAAMLAIPVADTLKRVDATNTITETVPRAGLWQAQTPQVFRKDLLLAAYARRGEFAGMITDDAQLIEFCGHPVKVVTGSPKNFKITTPDDLRLAQALLQFREQEVARPKRAFDDEAQW
jgi:2-C-methyl-D-erythritol 4-phosphate cytidylyltransferase